MLSCFFLILCCFLCFLCFCMYYALYRCFHSFFSYLLLYASVMQEKNSTYLLTCLLTKSKRVCEYAQDALECRHFLHGQHHLSVLRDPCSQESQPSPWNLQRHSFDNIYSPHCGSNRISKKGKSCLTNIRNIQVLIKNSFAI